MTKDWAEEEVDLLLRLGKSRDSTKMTWGNIGDVFDVSASSARHKYAYDVENVPHARDTEEETNRLTVEKSKNSMVITAKFAGIKTLDEMLAVCEVDLDVWRVDRYMINKWPIGAKAAKKDLVWKDGQITGSIHEDGLVIAPLFQVKVWLVRIKPEPIFPAMQIIECPEIRVNKELHVKEGGIGRSLVWCDPHFGFVRGLTANKPLIPLHNRYVLDVILQIAVLAKVERIDILGDILDCADWSDKFLRSPEFTETTQPALLEAHWWLRQFREVCGEMTLLEGNHGARIARSVISHLKAAYDLRAVDELDLPPAISLPKLLALDKLDIDYIGAYPSSVWLNNNIKLMHGTVTSITPGGAAAKVIGKADSVQIFGHNHKLEWVSRTVYRQNQQTQICGFSPGCVCWTDGRVPGYSETTQWQNACAIVDYAVGGDFYSINPIVIEDGKAIYNSKWVIARDRVDELDKCFEDWKFA